VLADGQERLRRPAGHLQWRRRAAAAGGPSAL